jgi:5'-3' exonuclease
MTMKLLIDGDIIAYRCGFAGEKTYYEYYKALEVRKIVGPDGEDAYEIPQVIEPPFTAENAKEGKEWAAGRDDEEELVRVPRKKIEPVEHVLHSVKMVLSCIEERFPDNEMHLVFSCPTKDNWRTVIYPEYKGNRPDRKPFWAEEIRAYMNKGPWNVIAGIDEEADDILCMMAHDCNDKGEDWILVSIDKDFYQIPGKHYDWVNEELIEIDEQRACLLHAVQCLMGDNTDNIKGIPGWGEGTAVAHLTEQAEGDFDEILREAYRTATDKKKENLLWPNPAEAEFQYVLNRALVTLPEDREHREALMQEVLDAWKHVEETA